MKKKKRTRTGNPKTTQAPKDTRRIGQKSSRTENEPLHQPDYLLEDHPELGIPSMVHNGVRPKQGHRTKK
jgi:hypothetical protein